MLFSSIFRRKFVLVYIALTDEECMQVKGKLINAGIFHKTKICGSYASSAREIGWGRRQSQYEIYVRVEDEHRANEAIHQG